MGKLKDFILSGMAGIQWDDLAVGQFRDAGFDAFAQAMAAYMEEQDAEGDFVSAEVSCIATGTLTTPSGATSPYSAAASITFTVGDFNSLKVYAKSEIESDTAPGDVSGLFSALALGLPTLACP